MNCARGAEKTKLWASGPDFGIQIWVLIVTDPDENGCNGPLAPDKGSPEIGKLTPMGFQVFWGSEGGR